MHARETFVMTEMWLSLYYFTTAFIKHFFHCICLLNNLSVCITSLSFFLFLSIFVIVIFTLHIVHSEAKIYSCG